MAEEQVEVIAAQPLQRGVAGVRYMFGTEAALRRLGAAKENLARHDEGIAAPAEPGDRLAHHLLRVAGLIALGVVEEIDALIVGGPENVGRGPDVDLLAERDPRSVRKFADFEACAAKAPVFQGTPPHAPRKLGALASSKLREGLEPASRNWKPLRDKSATRPSSPQA